MQSNRPIKPISANNEDRFEQIMIETEIKGLTALYWGYLFIKT